MSLGIRKPEGSYLAWEHQNKLMVTAALHHFSLWEVSQVRSTFRWGWGRVTYIIVVIISCIYAFSLCWTLEKVWNYENNTLVALLSRCRLSLRESTKKSWKISHRKWDIAKLYKTPHHVGGTYAENCPAVAGKGAPWILPLSCLAVVFVKHRPLWLSLSFC